ncbi:hypothetical protein [Nocardia sp. NBC_00416]|uniref:hypothetical protein n=1 Tax=Nocardia sp. NBC_00416 TaxID=2975991 RepID=UPI002E1C12C8
MGHYAAARTALRRLSAATSDPVLLSLAASTSGSLLRQLGWHALAAHHDGRAAAFVLPGIPAALDTVRWEAARHAQERAQTPPGARLAGYSAEPGLIDAAADALIGLAADALGTGRLALSSRLLERCSTLLDAAESGRYREPDPSAVPDARAAGAAYPRVRVRLRWVRAETALAGGHSDSALAEAEAALASAEQGPSVRHQVKSRLLVAAAAGAAGDTSRATALAARVDEQCRESGLVPLRWACAMLRTGLAGGPRDTAAGDAAACRTLIARRGGRFRDAGW